MQSETGCLTYPVVYIAGKVRGPEHKIATVIQHHSVATFCSPLARQDVDASTVCETGN